MVANQADCSGSQQRSAIKILVAKNYKKYTIYKEYVMCIEKQRYWQIPPTKLKHYCIVWNEQPQA